jgi:hypothetical protein
MRGGQGAGADGTPRWEWGAAAVLTVAVAALHAVRLLYAGGLWRDEAGAARLAMLPTIREIFGLFQHEAFPLLFPVTVRTYMAWIGGGDGALRAFGLAVGLAIAGILWLNARAARTVPLLSLALLGLDVPFLVYGDSLRGYGLGSALILLTYGLLARCLAVSNEPPLLIASLAVAAVASVQVVLSNAALLGALCAAGIVVAVARRRRRLAGWIAGCGALAALSLLPYAALLAAARREWSVIVTYPIRIVHVWHGLTATLGPRPVQGVWLFLLAVSLAAAVHGVHGSIRAVRTGLASSEGEPGSPANVALFAAVTILFALVADGVFLKTLGYRPRPWYYLPLMALLASAFDAVFFRFDSWFDRGVGRRLGLVRLAVVLLVAGSQALPLSRHLTARQTNVDLVARQVAASATPEDLVVVNSWYYGVSFNRYYAGTARWLTLPDIPDHRVHRYDLLKVRMAASHPIDDVLSAVAATLRSGHRVWLVGGARWPKPGEAVPQLPPAPLSPEGWHDWPYTTAWSGQLGSFLQGHAVQAAAVAVPAGGPVNDLEDLPLVVVEGWRAAL